MREADRIASARQLEESAQFKLSPLKTELKRRALRLGLLKRTWHHLCHFE